MKHLKYIYIILLLPVILNSCLIVKYPESKEVHSTISLSPKPEIPMSDILVRSKQGDMIAFLPKDWFYVNVFEKASADVFAVAVNPEYTKY